MQATLIYNTNAGNSDTVTPDALLAALRRAGYKPAYAHTEEEADLDDVLADVEGLVVAAGGDGTMRAVASRLVGRDVALALLPMGTANNIGHTLGIKGKPLRIVEGLERPRKIAFDVGRLNAPWGTRIFLEGMGYGFFADTLALYDPEQGKSILRGISTLTETLSNYRSYDCRLVLDGADISGDYLMVEVLNTKAVGPRLKLAPDADPNDGFFDVIVVHSEERTNFLRYVTGLLAEGFEDLPNVTAFSGRRLEIEWAGFPIHVDAEVLPGGVDWTAGGEVEGEHYPHLRGQEAIVVAELLPHALEVWLPR